MAQRAMMRGWRRACVCALAAVVMGVVPARAADTWTEVRSPHFRVVTNGRAGDARDVAANFERLHAVLQKTSRLVVRSDVPLTIVALKSGRQLRDMAELGSRDLAGLFIAGDDAHVVLLRLDLEEEDRYQVAYHEYVHLLVHRTFGSLPLWLNEGLAGCTAMPDWTPTAFCSAHQPTTI
jgi:hypothetical protein